MSRYKNRRESIDFMRVDRQTLEALCSDEIFSTGIRRNEGKKGFTTQGVIQPPMYEGEGLPENTDPELHLFPDSAITFELQLLHDRSGGYEIRFARKGAGRHFKFPYPDLVKKKPGRNDPLLASYDFCNNLEDYLASTLSMLLYACGHKHTSPKERKEAFESIFEWLEYEYRQILDWHRWKEVGTREPGHTKITPLSKTGEIPKNKIVVSMPIKAGREPEIESDDLRKLILGAFTELNSTGMKITQDTVGEYVFPNAGQQIESLGSKLRGALKTNRLSWKELKGEYNKYK